jgi:hypothetical protein
MAPSTEEGRLADSEDVRILREVGTGPTEDGKGVVLDGIFEDGERFLMAIPVEGVGAFISSVIDGLNRATERLGPELAPKNRIGEARSFLALKPTRVGLIDGAPPNHVRVGISIGATDLVFEMPVQVVAGLAHQVQIPGNPASAKH